MPATRLTRRAPGITMPFLPAPLFSTPAFPSLSQAFNDMNAKTNEMMQSLFSNFPTTSVTERFPAINVAEAKNEFTVTAELPGMSAENVTIDFSDGMLTIRGEKETEETKEEEDMKYYMWERRFGSFQRALPFPGGVAEDKIKASFKDGLLTVHLPKAENGKNKHHTIKITES